jgi:hypothetical protein
MKPLHASLKRLSKCPCCQSKHSKHNAKGKNNGKSAARNLVKLLLKKATS